MNIIITEQLDPVRGIISELNFIDTMLYFVTNDAVEFVYSFFLFCIIVASNVVMTDKWVVMLDILTNDEFKLVSSIFIFFALVISNMVMTDKWVASYLSFKNLAKEQRTLRALLLLSQALMVPYMFGLFSNPSQQEEITMPDVDTAQLNTLCPVWSINTEHKLSYSQCKGSNSKIEMYQWTLPIEWRSVNVRRVALGECDHQPCLKISVTDLDTFMELVAPKQLESMLNEVTTEFLKRVVRNREWIVEFKAERDNNLDKWKARIE